MCLKRKRQNRKLLESFAGAERNCCKIVIIGIKREYLPYRHFCWKMTVLGGKQFLRQCYPEAIVKVVFFCFCLFVFFFSRFSSTLTGGKGGKADICRGTVPTLLARIVGTGDEFPAIVKFVKNNPIDFGTLHTFI